jgi:hypothetical protein
MEYLIKTSIMKFRIFTLIIFLFSGTLFGYQLSSGIFEDSRLKELVNMLPAGNSGVLHQIMEELANYEGAAIMSISENLVPPGKGDDSKQRFAISGIVKYVSQNKDPFLRLKISNAICKAIEASDEDEVKDFLLQELQYVAGDEAVLTAVSCLSNSRLADPAARVLMRIDSEASKGALFHALKSEDFLEKISVIQAVSYNRCNDVSSLLRELLKNSEGDFKKVILRSLAESADMLSAEILALEAENAGYRYEVTDAAGSYLHYLKRIADEGNVFFAEEQLNKLIENDQVPEHTKNAAKFIMEQDGFYRFSPDKDEELHGFKPLFNGVNLEGWTGNTLDYYVEKGMIVCQPTGQGSGNLYTTKEYSDFVLCFEFKLTPGANNGLGIRTPMTGDAAYAGMELQILDNEAEVYKNLAPYQYHGSVYGVIPAKRSSLKPVGEWNYQEVYANGNHIKIVLNGNVILDGDIAEASMNGTKTIDNRDHPGLLNRSGHIGFLGHGSFVQFRNIMIKEIVD